MIDMIRFSFIFNLLIILDCVSVLINIRNSFIEIIKKIVFNIVNSFIVIIF